MKIYLSENIAKSAYDRLAARAEIITDFRHAEELDAIMIRRVYVTRDIIAKAKKLKIIAMHGVGFDTIDLEAAKEYGIPVKNVPNQSAESVAELAVSFLLSLSRKLKMANTGIKCNKYNTFAPLELIGTEVYGKTLALVGMGNIAMRIGEIMKAAFKVRIIGYDPYISLEKAQQMGVEKFFALQQLFQEADLVNVSVPLVDSTRNLVNEDVLITAKKSLILVNTSRGGVVDEQALYKALVNKQISAAASDVFLSEPPKADNPLVSLDNFIATPHIGGSTNESLERVGNAAVDNIFSILDNPA